MTCAELKQGVSTQPLGMLVGSRTPTESLMAWLVPTGHTMMLPLSFFLSPAVSPGGSSKKPSEKYFIKREGDPYFKSSDSYSKPSPPPPAAYTKPAPPPAAYSKPAPPGAYSKPAPPIAAYSKPAPPPATYSTPSPPPAAYGKAEDSSYPKDGPKSFPKYDHKPYTPHAYGHHKMPPQPPKLPLLPPTYSKPPHLLSGGDKPKPYSGYKAPPISPPPAYAKSPVSSPPAYEEEEPEDKGPYDTPAPPTPPYKETPSPSYKKEETPAYPPAQQGHQTKEEETDYDKPPPPHNPYAEGKDKEDHTHHAKPTEPPHHKKPKHHKPPKAQPHKHPKHHTSNGPKHPPNKAHKTPSGPAYGSAPPPTYGDEADLKPASPEPYSTNPVPPPPSSYDSYEDDVNIVIDKNYPGEDGDDYNLGKDDTTEDDSYDSYDKEPADGYDKPVAPKPYTPLEDATYPTDKAYKPSPPSSPPAKSVYESKSKHKPALPPHLHKPIPPKHHKKYGYYNHHTPPPPPPKDDYSPAPAPLTKDGGSYTPAPPTSPPSEYGSGKPCSSLCGCCWVLSSQEIVFCHFQAAPQ